MAPNARVAAHVVRQRALGREGDELAAAVVDRPRRAGDDQPRAANVHVPGVCSYGPM